MSTQKGNSKKKGQAHQNQWKFKHNANSRLTKTISHAPLDFCCEKCLKKLQWKVQYRKYNPRTIGFSLYQIYIYVVDNQNLCFRINKNAEGINLIQSP